MVPVCPVLGTTTPGTFSPPDHISIDVSAPCSKVINSSLNLCIYCCVCPSYRALLLMWISPCPTDTTIPQEVHLLLLLSHLLHCPPPQPDCPEPLHVSCSITSPCLIRAMSSRPKDKSTLTLALTDTWLV